MRYATQQRIVSLALAIALSGCASATKRYEQGAELEARGAYAEAAERYIQALKKDRTHAESRTRLLDAGSRAIQNYLDVAEAERAAGNQTRRADHYMAVDDLVREASDVGVALVVSDSYPDERRGAMQAAIAHLLDQGAADEERRRWRDALRSYERVARYEPRLEQEAQVREARIRCTLGWAEDDMAAHRYRSAVTRADQVVALLGGPEHADARRALALRGAALEHGTLYVAFAPLWRSDAAAQFLTGEFLSALNDELELRHWTAPPLFIATSDPVLVRRELRRQGIGYAVLTPREAGRVGRELEADFVVTGEIAIFTLTERDVRRETHKATTRSGAETTYATERGTVTYRAQATYAIMDVHRRREVRRGEVEVSESGDFERAVYSGHPDDLVLSRNERRRFDPDRQREASRDIEDRAVARLSGRLADEVYRHLLNMVP